jgi:hypothetical protein
MMPDAPACQSRVCACVFRQVSLLPLCACVCAVMVGVSALWCMPYAREIRRRLSCICGRRRQPSMSVESMAGRCAYGVFCTFFLCSFAAPMPFHGIPHHAYCPYVCAHLQAAPLPAKSNDPTSRVATTVCSPFSCHFFSNLFSPSLHARLSCAQAREEESYGGGGGVARMGVLALCWEEFQRARPASATYGRGVCACNGRLAGTYLVRGGGGAASSCAAAQKSCVGCCVRWGNEHGARRVRPTVAIPRPPRPTFPPNLCALSCSCGCCCSPWKCRMVHARLLLRHPCSFLVASFPTRPRNPRPPPACLRVADRRLYVAKRLWRRLWT